MPLPKAVRYDAPSGRIVVDSVNGSSFMVPARALQDLENATDAELAEVELQGETGLHWETLDADFTIKGLMAGIFGTARFMQALREKSEATLAVGSTSFETADLARKAG
ncbi:DUF2442 domain-containing protein [Aureimonas psammosilenae]|uniref:DUF2442 domain-containing protein n=1 Tax=Aureimonas psammosilenae TaxID=2495496 RepID=UPI001F384892|nr:DUF2442 domain-containing protein [Aureimonas psammosilenae]